MFLPVGHDQGLRRFPWLTAVIMAVCVLVQLHQSIFGTKESDLIDLLDERAKIEETAVLAYGKAAAKEAMLAARSTPGGLQAQREAFVTSMAKLIESFRSGDMTGTDNDLYRKWLGTKLREEDMRRRNISARLAYDPHDRVSPALLGSAFAHAGWLHLIGNMLFLFLVGCNLEDRWGRPVFGGLYAAGAAISALAFGAAHDWSGPGLIGASGAVAAAMGAFLICFLRARIQLLMWLGFMRPRIVEVSAFWAMPAWFLVQLLNAVAERTYGSPVAYSAHVGGFAFGVLVAVLLKATTIEKRWLLPATAKGVEWHEDPAFLRALDLIQKGSLATAIPLLQNVVKQNPRHEAAWENLARLAIQQSDAQLANSALPTYVGLLPRDRLPAVAVLLDETRLLDIPLALNDRALFMLLRATDAVNDAATGMRIAKRLLAEFPKSTYLPRALWELARLQEAAGRSDLATATLEDLIRRFPDDTFAEQAESSLRRVRAANAPVSRPPDLGSARAVPGDLPPRSIAVPEADDVAAFEIEHRHEQRSPAVAGLPDRTRGPARR